VSALNIWENGGMACELPYREMLGLTLTKF
jgi:hypothetical protein